jgi:hypothetical protein
MKRGIESAYILRVNKALEMYGDKAEASVTKELSSIHHKGVFSQRRLRDLTPAQRKSIITSSLFLKEKFLSTGAFEKLKSRLVGGGNLQDRDKYSEDETSSPTVSLQGLYMTVSLAAKEGRKISTMDIGTAYLNADMKKEVLMRIAPNISRMLVNIDGKAYRQEEDGSIIVRLNKALYGCVESAKLWYDNLMKTLTGMGFRSNGKDRCVLNVTRNGHQVTLCIYVDDILCTSIDDKDLDWVENHLKAKYGEVTAHKGKVHSYLGQTFDFSVEGEVYVSMEGYTVDLLELYKVKGFKPTPAKDGLFDVNDLLERLSEEDADMFRSRVAKIFYMAQRTRPDVLTAVAFLSTRVHKSTSEDMEKLDRVLMYLNGTAALGIRLRPCKDLRVLAYVDASFAVHADMKSHTGGVMSLGFGPVYVCSKKQGLVTNSSTESELVGVSDILPHVIWTRDFLLEQGYKMGPSLLFQDNMSTIALANRGFSKSNRTRHIAIRYFFIKDRIEAKEIEVEYLPTGEMIADIMTKPLQGALFRTMRAWLMGLEQ